MVSELHPDVRGVQKKNQMTIFTMPNKMSIMKYSPKPVPGLADVGVPHGVEDGPITHPRCLEGVCKKVQMTNFSVPKNKSFMKYALKAVPGVADVGVPHGGKDDLQNSSPGVRIKNRRIPRCSA